MKCKQKIDLGVYHASSRFFFVFDDETEETEFLKIFNHNLSKHPQVGIIQRVKTKKIDKNLYKIYGYNFFAKENNLPIVQINYLWTPNNVINNIRQAFTNLYGFDGKHFKVGAQPWSHDIQAYKIPKEDPEYSETNRFR